jgi:hypothetical protein
MAGTAGKGANEAEKFSILEVMNRQCVRCVLNLIRPFYTLDLIDYRKFYNRSTIPIRIILGFHRVSKIEIILIIETFIINDTQIYNMTTHTLPTKTPCTMNTNRDIDAGILAEGESVNKCGMCDINGDGDRTVLTVYENPGKCVYCPLYLCLLTLNYLCVCGQRAYINFAYNI